MMKVLVVVMVGGSFADVVDGRRAIRNDNTVAVPHITFGWVIVWLAFAGADGHDEFVYGFTVFAAGHFHDWREEEEGTFK